MRAGGDAPKDRIGGIDREAGWGVAEQVLAATAGEQEAGEAIGERRLADAGRSGNQPGMRETTRTIVIEQGRLGPGVTNQLGVLAGRRRARIAVVAGVSHFDRADSDSRRRKAWPGGPRRGRCSRR